MNRLIAKAEEGLRINNVTFLALGRKGLLKNNFRASLKGCNKPMTPNLLGPFRSWRALRVLRSNRVRKATLIRALSSTTPKFKAKVKIWNLVKPNQRRAFVTGLSVHKRFSPSLRA